VGLPDKAHDGPDVVGDRRIDIPEVYRVPASVFLGVVPGQQEIGDAPGLAGILPGDPEQSLESVPAVLLVFRGEVQFHIAILSTSSRKPGRLASAAMCRDVLFKGQAGLFGFDPRFVRNTLQPVIFGFRRSSHSHLKLSDGGRELVRFVFGCQPHFFFTAHAPLSSVNRSEEKYPRDCGARIAPTLSACR
jgi:hypothetical protein